MNNTTLAPITTTEVPSNLSWNALTDYPDACVTLSAISCTLSIFGAIGIFVTYGLLREIRNVTRKLIICLTVADLFTAIGYLISVYRYSLIPLDKDADGDEHLPLLCVIQSGITTYSGIASFFLTVCIAFHLSWTLVQREHRTGTTRALVIFNVISWTIPGIVVGISLWQTALGEDKKTTAATGPWCWVNTETDNIIFWMLFDGKFWEICCFLVTASSYVLLKYYKFLRQRLHEVHHSLRDEDSNVIYLWFVLYVTRIWGTLRFLIYAFDPDISKENTFMAMLLFLQAFGDPAQAFCNFTLFCLFDRTIKTHMRRWLRSFRRRMSCRPYAALIDEDHTEPKVINIQNRASNYESIHSDSGRGKSSRQSNQSITSSEMNVFT